jgi:hypothetical protein
MSYLQLINQMIERRQELPYDGPSRHIAVFIPVKSKWCLLWEQTLDWI